MKIDNINKSQSFGIKVNKKFVKSAQNFYLNRGLSIQYDAFQKHLEKMEYWASEKSEIIHFNLYDNGNQTLYLGLKNREINKKQALILGKFNKFNELLRFFNNIDEYSLIEYEKLL